MTLFLYPNKVHSLENNSVKAKHPLCDAHKQRHAATMQMSSLQPGMPQNSMGYGGNAYNPSFQGIAPVPTQLQMESGERTAGSQEGNTALDDIHNIKIVYNAEIRDLDICGKLRLCFATFGMAKYNKARSYLYVRENSIESNFSVKCLMNPMLCSCNTDHDFIQIWYFDNDPLLHERSVFICSRSLFIRSGSLMIFIRGSATSSTAIRCVR